MPGSQCSQTTNTATSITPSANSGIEVITIDVDETSIEHAARPHPGEHAQQQRQRHDDRKGEAGQQRGVAEPVPQHVVDRRLVQRRVAEIAEIPVAARVLEIQAECRVLQRVGLQSGQHADPAHVADQQRIVQVQLLVEQVDLFLQREGPSVLRATLPGENSVTMNTRNDARSSVSSISSVRRMRYSAWPHGRARVGLGPKRHREELRGAPPAITRCAARRCRTAAPE